MISKIELKNKEQMPRRLFENTIDVYIIVRTNNCEVIGVFFSCRHIKVIKERDPVAKKLFNIPPPEFSKIHTDRVEKMKKNLVKVRAEPVVYAMPLMSEPFFQKPFQENVKPHCWSNLATELHNNLGQMLTMANMKLDETDTASFPPEASDNLADLSELLNDTLTYTRDIMTKLKPPPVFDKEDIKGVLEWIVKQMKQYYLEVILENDEQPKPLGEEELRIISQCARELLLNVVKYANVNKA